MNRVASITVVLVLAGCSRSADVAAQAPGTPPPAAAAVTSEAWLEVRPRTLEEEVQAVGSLRARQSTRVGAEVAGEVLEVLVDVGARVTKGQPLVRLDPTFFEIEASQRRAELEAAKARLASAEQAITTAAADVEHAQAAAAEAALQLERMRALWEKPDGQAPSIPRSRYDDAVFGEREASARLRASQSRVAEAQARRAEAAVGVQLAAEALRWAEERLRRTVVEAPYDGVVTARLVDPGEPVTATPVTHLVEVQDAALYLELSLPQELRAVVREGTGLRFEVEGVEDAAAGSEVALVFPTIDPDTRSFRCRALVEGRGLGAGMLARVRVTTGRVEGALVVPRAALRATDGGWSVRVRGPDGAPVARRVTLGLVTEQEAQVVEGLAAGEHVLVSS